MWLELWTDEAQRLRSFGKTWLRIWERIFLTLQRYIYIFKPVFEYTIRIRQQIDFLNIGSWDFIMRRRRKCRNVESLQILTSWTRLSLMSKEQEGGGMIVLMGDCLCLLLNIISIFIDSDKKKVLMNSTKAKPKTKSSMQKRAAFLPTFLTTFWGTLLNTVVFGSWMSGSHPRFPSYQLCDPG